MTSITHNNNCRAKNICFTLFDLGDDVLHKLKLLFNSGKATYLVFQHELAPGTGKEHIQGYIELVAKLRWQQLKVLIGATKMYCAARMGTSQQAADYCKKDETRVPGSLIYEEGHMSLVGQGKRTDIMECKEMIDSGATMQQVAEEHFGTVVRLHKGLVYYKQLRSPKRDEHTICLILYGESKAGKTTLVRKMFPDAVWIMGGVSGTWFDKYDDHDVVVFDEFSGTMPFHWFKRIVDASPLELDAKGSSRNFRARMVVFLSNKDYENWYTSIEGVERDAFNNRCHLVMKACARTDFKGVKTGKFYCELKKSMLPYGAALPLRWCLPGLTCAESREVITYNTSQARIEEIQKKCDGLRIKVRSEGVILTPSLLKNLDFQDACHSYLNTIIGHLEFETPPAVDILAASSSELQPSPPPPSESTPPPSPPSHAMLVGLDDEILQSMFKDVPTTATAAPPASSYYDDVTNALAPAVRTAVVRPDQVLKRNVFKSNYPELTWDDLRSIKAVREAGASFGSSAPVPPLKRTRRRRRVTGIASDDDKDEKGE